MNLFYKGNLCIANGMIVTPKFFEKVCVKLSDGRILGHVYDFERENMRIQIHPDLLFFKKMTFVIRFPVTYISELKEENDQMIVIVPDQPFLPTIEDYHKKFEKAGSAQTSSYATAWLCVNFSEDPIAKNLMNAYYQKKKRYLERLKKGERIFHGFTLDH
jgi:hypothetical protein